VLVGARRARCARWTGVLKTSCFVLLCFCVVGQTVYTSSRRCAGSSQRTTARRPRSTTSDHPPAAATCRAMRATHAQLSAMRRASATAPVLSANLVGKGRRSKCVPESINANVNVKDMSMTRHHLPAHTLTPVQQTASYCREHQRTKHIRPPSWLLGPHLHPALHARGHTPADGVLARRPVLAWSASLGWRWGGGVVDEFDAGHCGSLPTVWLSERNDEMMRCSSSAIQRYVEGWSGG
jgi:hypothetical protein